MAVCARLGELGRGDRAMLQQQVADAHVAHIVVLRLQRQVLEEAGDPTQPACMQAALLSYKRLLRPEETLRRHFPPIAKSDSQVPVQDCGCTSKRRCL